MAEIGPTEMVFVDCHYYHNPKAQRMGNIDWIPISDLSDALKDGREVLFWDVWGVPERKSARVATFSGTDWRDDEGVPIWTPTHFAEINPPA